MSWVVYMLECADGTLYIGSTNDLVRRLAEHNESPRGAKYTRGRRPVTLRYSESVETLGAARAREHALKQLSRAQKLALATH